MPRDTQKDEAARKGINKDQKTDRHPANKKNNSEAETLKRNSGKVHR